jgi:hypothetical protein
MVDVDELPLRPEIREYLHGLARHVVDYIHNDDILSHPNGILYRSWSDVINVLRALNELDVFVHLIGRIDTRAAALVSVMAAFTMPLEIPTTTGVGEISANISFEVHVPGVHAVTVRGTAKGKTMRL